jgi:hypothetical protein
MKVLRTISGVLLFLLLGRLVLNVLEERYLPIGMQIMP